MGMLQDVGFGFMGPLRGEAGVVAADDEEVGDLAEVEVSCADDDVEGVEGTVSSVDTISADAGDRDVIVRWTLLGG